MKKTIKLIYSSGEMVKKQEGANLFSNIQEMKKSLSELKKQTDSYTFDEKSVREISRSDSYAVFPELKTKMDKNPDYKITLDDIRESLKTRGINEEPLQNKVLFCLLQNKAGLQFGMASVIQSFLMESDINFYVDQESISVKLDVKNENEKVVKMIIDFSFRETIITKGSLESKEAIKVHMEIDIAPKKVTLNHIQIEQVSKSEEADNAFKALQNNQSGLWSKIKTFFNNFASKYFGAKTDSSLENKEENSMSPRM